MRPARNLLIPLLALTLAPAATAAAAPTVTFTPQLQKAGTPDDLAVGPDGEVWFTAFSHPGAVGHIGADGVVTELSESDGLKKDANPAGITSGPDGVWVAMPGKNRIARITPDNQITDFSVSGQPIGITAAADARLWFTAQKDDGAIGVMTPAGDVTRFTTGLTEASRPHDITIGPDGNGWFTEAAGPRVGRVTPEGVITEFPTGSIGAVPWQITTGPDGNLWFTERGAAPAIVRMTTEGIVTRFPVEGDPYGIVTGGDGALYFTDHTPGAVGRITTTGVITRFDGLVPAEAELLGIIAGSDGALWFAADAIDAIGRMTVAPVAGEVAAPVVSGTTAAVAGALTPNSETTTGAFEYGLTTDYGSRSADVAVAASAASAPVSATLTGLVPGATYHVRVVAANATGVSAGPDRTFVAGATGTGPGAGTGTDPSTPTGTPGSGTAPAPVFGKALGGLVIRGAVRVRLPGEQHFNRVSGGVKLPNGSVVDARAGTLAIVSALTRGGKTQRAVFHGARFRIGQRKQGKGMVDIWTREKATGCDADPGSAVATAAAKKAQPALWTKDRKGRYRTHGNNSVATVRGTVWVTRETCAGTRTAVKEGSVIVRDNDAVIGVVVRAGHSHLAPAAR